MSEYYEKQLFVDNSSESTLEPIDVFEELYRDNPDCLFLSPRAIVEQSVARKVVRPGNRNHHIGYFPSRINQAMVTFESNLEKQSCVLFESYSEIQSYQSQPYGIKLRFLDKDRTVYPDFEVITKTGAALVDIRYEKNIKSPKFKARLSAIQLYCDQRGLYYTLLTERDIQVQRLETASFLLSLSHGTPHIRLTNIVFQWLTEVLPLKFCELFKLTERYPSVRTVIASFILDGVITIDWNKEVYNQKLLLNRQEQPE